MEKSLTQLVEEMQQIRRAEQALHTKACKLDMGIQVLKTKKYKIIQDAKTLQSKRHELAREYHAQKSPCRNVLREAEKALGRRLTLDEIQRIEIYYNNRKETARCATQ